MYTVLKNNTCKDSDRLVYVSCFDDYGEAERFCNLKNKKAINPECDPDSVFTYFFTKGFLVIPKKGE